MHGISVRAASKDDAMEISEIYNYYVLNTHITFEERAVSEELGMPRCDAQKL